MLTAMLFADPALIALLRDQPLVLLFAVLALGFALGRVRVAGVSLGVAAVLFVGLAAGALDPALQVPEVVQRFGLVLFVYTVGLASGPGFVASFRRRGLRDALFTAVLLALAAAAAWLTHVIAGVPAARTAGLFAGSLTNTPALAAVIERIRALHPGDAALAAEPVVAYSLTYPMGVLGVIMALAVARRVWRKELAPAAGGRDLEVASLRVTVAAMCAQPLETLVSEQRWRVRFARRRRGDVVSILDGREPLAVGDLVTVVGVRDELERVRVAIGEAADEQLELDRTDLDFRRIFVSDPAVAGQPLSRLRLLERFGALVTRVRRGDVDLLPDGRTVLELGDRVRVLGPRSRMGEVARFFGDSYRALAEVDVLSFALGIAAGLLLGLVPIPLPSGDSFQIGVAGGPLLVGLWLGAVGRSGPVVWQLPFSANLTLRQIGLVLFLAGVGTRSGWVFAHARGEPGALPLFVAGALVTCASAALALWLGRRVLRVPAGVLLGMVAGLHTQPAALAFAAESTGDDAPNTGYAALFPFATILKILIAQLLFELLRR